MFEEAKPLFIGLGVVINIARGALKNNLPFFSDLFIHLIGVNPHSIISF